jgi:hypothetical protein
MDAISKYHNFKIIHGQYISYLYIYIFFNIVYILTLEFIIIFFFVLGFVANVIRLAFEHHQLFIHMQQKL